MSNYIGYRDGGKTDEQGLHEELLQLFTPGVPTVGITTSWAVSQRAAGANMSVDVAVGDGHIAKTTYSYWGWSDAVNNVVISAADPTNPRRDIIVAYVDLSVVSSVSSNNPNALKFKSVTGTPAGSPVDPNGAAIQASVGAGNPYIQLARVSVAALAANIVNANIADLRAAVALKGKLYGGSTNTVGHTVPNVADDTVALLNATQTFTNKTITNPIINWDGWQSLGYAPNTITALGNRFYSLVFNGIDLTGLVDDGMVGKNPRSVTPPTQCTNLDGSTQYWSRASGSLTGMTFTDDFVVSAWVKVASYSGTTTNIVSRYNGTSGWALSMNSTGTLYLSGFNAGAANYSLVQTYQSLPLNKWVHVAAQLDMSTFTATTTTSYIMLDGVDAPVLVTRNGTNPTALVQAGNLEIGATNGGTGLFSGRIAQVAIYNAKVTQATVLASMNQTLSGSETSAVSVYKFDGNGNDSNANANNLTANGGAAASTVDSPMNATEYWVTMSKTFSVNTTIIVHTPDGYTLPTTGGVASTSYSNSKAPFGYPGGAELLGLVRLCANQSTTSTTPTAVLGLSVSTYVTAGQRIRLVFDASVYNTNVSIGIYPGVYAGAVSTTSQVKAKNITSPGANYSVPFSVDTEYYVTTTGQLTFNAGVKTDANTVGVVGNPQEPGEFRVELVSF